MVKLLKMNDGDEGKNQSSSAQIVASIDDLLLEIIQRLPFRTLVRLPLVSNYWNSLILDSKLCLSCNRPTVGLICEGFENPCRRTQYIIFLDKSISPPIRKMIPTIDIWYRHCKILHSCNGLLLCLIGDDYSKKYYVCNPTTRKYIALPQVLLVNDYSRVSMRGMYLAFDPSKSPHYKVVCILETYYNGLHNSFVVYSSETGAWRKGTELFKDVDGINYEDGVYWNGAIHWINIATKPREPVYFNLDCDQNPKVFPKPPLKDKCYEINDYSFGESCDHLHFVDAYRTVSEFIVYEMRRDYSEWFVKYKVNIPEMKTDIVPEASGRYTLVVRGKNDKDCFLVIRIWKRILRYNFEQKTCELLCDLESTVKDGSVYWGRKCPFQYIESLSSV